jgi:ParB family chromosome partitioning protein
MTQETQQTPEFSTDEIRSIPIDLIEPDKNQLRKEFREDELEALAKTIEKDGQIQPILVTKGKAGKYKIVDGERRWRAFKKLVDQAKADTESQIEPPSTIKAIYVEEENQLVSILGNIARNSYNPMELAYAIALITERLGTDATDDDVAGRIGKSRTIVVEYNSLLKLPEKIREKARKNSCVPFNRLKALAASKTPPDEKIKAYEELHKKYSVEKQKSDKDDSRPNSNRETRSVIAIRKKLDTMKDVWVKFNSMTM